METLTAPKGRVPYGNHSPVDSGDVKIHFDHEISKDNSDPDPDNARWVTQICASYRVCSGFAEMRSSARPNCPTTGFLSTFEVEY
ncbi:MAG: hypothetical protein FWC44_02165 [Methanomassiliicoccaceae archaeon]|nr:hypothetical protein [Methanomassiliicoccaceae archaeon]